MTDPWRDLEDRLSEVGVLAGEAERYRAIRAGSGPALRTESLALATQARTLHRRQPAILTDVAGLADRLGAIADRYRALLSTVRASPEYHAAVAALAAGDRRALTTLIPAIFAEAHPATELPAAYYPVPVTDAPNRLMETAALADHLATICTRGIPAAEAGDAPATDDGLRAVALQDRWADLDTPVAIQVDPDQLDAPLFRVGISGQILVYVPGTRLAHAATVVLATAPGPDCWPDLGTDYRDFLAALRAALRERRCPYRLIPTNRPQPRTG